MKPTVSYTHLPPVPAYKQFSSKGITIEAQLNKSQNRNYFSHCLAETDVRNVHESTKTSEWSHFPERIFQHQVNQDKRISVFIALQSIREQE